MRKLHHGQNGAGSLYSGAFGISTGCFGSVGSTCLPPEDNREIQCQCYQDTHHCRERGCHCNAGWGTPWGFAITHREPGHSSAAGIEGGQSWELESPVDVRGATNALAHWSQRVNSDTRDTNGWIPTQAGSGDTGNAHPVNRLRRAKNKLEAVVRRAKSWGGQASRTIPGAHKQDVALRSLTEDETACRIPPGEYRIARAYVKGVCGSAANEQGSRQNARPDGQSRSASIITSSC